MRIILKHSIITCLILSCCLINPGFAQKKQHDPTSWDETTQKFEQQDRQTQPALDGILFLGSSSIGRWDTDRLFPEYTTTNRGFGGSHIEDSIYYFNRLVLPSRPRAIVFYAGDNDIAFGKSPESVAKDFETFANKVHLYLPQTRILYVSIKPSRSRWKLVDKMRQTNQLIKTYIADYPYLDFLDIDADMLDATGMPDPELFRSDQLHLSEAGYQIWTKKVKDWFDKVGIEKQSGN